MANVRFKNGDITDRLANELQHYVDFYHVPTGINVEFKAFLKNIDNDFVSNWTSEEVYGKMDPVETFRNTKRTISLSWVVPAVDFEEAKENLERCSILSSMLYGTYNQIKSDPNNPASSLNATAINANPLMKVKFMNLIQDVSAPESDNAQTSGLLCRLNGLSWKPNLDMGFFDDFKGNIYPKEIALSCVLTALHQHPMGWSNGLPIGDFSRFPFGIDVLNGQGTDQALIEPSQEQQETSRAAERQQNVASNSILKS